MDSEDLSRRIHRYAAALYFFAASLLYIYLSRSSLQAWLRYADTELYSYLYITPLVAALLTIFILGDKRLGPDTVSGSAAALVAAAALGIILIGFETFFIEQVLILSMILLVYSTLVAVAGRGSLRSVLALSPLVLLMVPPPQYYVYIVSSHLTNIVGRLSYRLALMMGARVELLERYGILVAKVVEPGGKSVFFEIAPVCSGVIGFLSVAAVSPLIIYIAYRGERSRLHRAVAAVLGVLVLALLMFAANVLRLALVFYMTHLYGYSIGYGLFHYTPEIVLILPVAYIAIRLVEAVAGKYTLTLRLPRLKPPENIMALGLLIAIVIPAASALAASDIRTPDAVFVNTVQGPPALLFHGEEKPRPLIANSTNIHILYIGRERSWEKSLGPTTRVHFYRGDMGNKTIYIYIEFSRKPSQIHMWELCLWWQNITVYGSIFINYYDERADYAMLVDNVYYGKGMLRGTLIYWRDIVYTENGLEYFRATIMYNRYDGRNVTEQDVKLINKTAYTIWYRAISASYARTRYGPDIKQGITAAIIAEIAIGVIPLIIYTRLHKHIYRIAVAHHPLGANTKTSPPTGSNQGKNSPSHPK